MWSQRIWPEGALARDDRLAHAIILFVFPLEFLVFGLTLDAVITLYRFP